MNLLNEYNSPSGSYQFNILKKTFDIVINTYNIGISNLVMYKEYTDYSDLEILKFYDPFSIYVDELYPPFYSKLYNPTGPTNFFYNQSFYDFKEFYTGTYSSGTFIGPARPDIFYSYNPSLANNKFDHAKHESYKKEKIDLYSENSSKNVTTFRVPTSSKPISLNQVAQTSAQVSLNGTATSTTISSIKTDPAGQTSTTVESTQKSVGTNTNNTTAKLVRNQ